jgi:hypothetical protein
VNLAGFCLLRGMISSWTFFFGRFSLPKANHLQTSKFQRVEIQQTHARAIHSFDIEQALIVL